jgi:hypothetical protein
MTESSTDRAAVLHRLHAVLEAENGLLAQSLRAPHPGWEDDTVFAALVASGARASRQPDEYALLVESILEGYLLHYSEARILEPPDDDQRLLAGDFLYAFGLTRLARLGDMEAVQELADLISLCAQAHAPATGGPGIEPPWALTASLWAIAMMTVAEGGWGGARQAKRLAREEGAAAAEEIRAAACTRAEEVGARPHLERALIAFAAHTARAP